MEKQKKEKKSSQGRNSNLSNAAVSDKKSKKRKRDDLESHNNASTGKPASHHRTIAIRSVAPVPQAGTKTAKSASSGGGLSSLQEQFKRKLEGARFRSINEELYTTPGVSAFEQFQAEPEKFHIYHRGYREQAAQWPCNPLHLVIDWIRQRNKPREIVADMGCGEAILALSVPNTVHSFDLVAGNKRVTACDIAHTPLEDNSVDIVVFCLSLMGTNYHEFLFEAHRILKPRGIIKIVEVRSRFEGNEAQRLFVSYLQQCGFEVKTKAKEEQQQLESNRMFFEVEGYKSGRCAREAPPFTLKACQYKKR